MKIYFLTLALKNIVTLFLEMLSSYLRLGCRDCIDLRYKYLVKFFKIVGRTVRGVWFAQDANYCPSRSETCRSKNLTGWGHELVQTGYLDHLCEVSKL